MAILSDLNIAWKWAAELSPLMSYLQLSQQNPTSINTEGSAEFALKFHSTNTPTKPQFQLPHAFIFCIT